MEKAKPLTNQPQIRLNRMNQKPFLRLLARRFWLILIPLLIQQTVRADVQTWWGLGATPNWSDSSGNWTNLELAASVPANGDSLLFANTTQTTSSNDLSGLSVNWLAFTSGDFDLFGNPLTITGGVTNSTADNIFDLSLILGASQTFEVDGSSLTFNQGIAAGGNTLTFAGAGAINLYGAVSGAGSLVMSGTGTMLITNRQPLTGGIFVNNGTLQVSTPGNLDFGGALTPSLITINTNGTVYGTTTHAIGGGTSVFVNRGTWMLDDEDYKQNLTMWDGTIEPGPNPDSSGGQLRVGLAGGSGSYTWYITNSLNGSTISAPLDTIGAGVNLTLDVARGQAASDLTISGPIELGGSITFTRNGITTLTGNNTHSGPFTIAGGTVVLQNQLLSSTITVASNAVFDISGTSFTLNTNQILTGAGMIPGTLYDNNSFATGATLAPGVGAAAGTLTMGGLSLQGQGLQLNFNLSGTATVGGNVNSLLIVTNFSAVSGNTNTVNLLFNGTPQTGVPYTLIQYGNGFSGDPSTFLSSSASRYTYTFTNNLSASAIQVIVTGAPGNLVWEGDNVLNNWDVNTSTNWLLGAVGSVFLQGDNVTFNDSGSATPAVNIVGAVQPSTITVNSTKNYTLAGSGTIASGRLLKSNSGDLTILTTDTSTGGGILNGAGTVTVGNGGTNVAGIGSGLLTNNTSVTFYENASSTYSGSMSGTGSLTAFVPGATLTLTGTNTFTGGLTIANGTVQIGNNTAGVSPSVAGTITNGGTLNLYRADAFTNRNVITDAGNTLEYGNGDVNVRGAGGMTVDGTGSINLLPEGSLSIGQSASGIMTVNNGAVINIGLNYLLGNPNAAGDWGSVVQNGGAITVGNQMRIGHWASEISTNIMNGGTLSVPNEQVAVGWDGIGLMTLNGGTVNCRSLTVDDDGFTAAINGLISVFTMNGGQLNIGVGGIGGNVQTNTDVNNIVLGGGTIAATAPAGFTSSMNMVLTNGGPTFDTTNTTVTLSGILSGSGALTKQGTGYLILNGANTFTNVTTVAAGTLEGSGTSASPVVVQSGANLSAGGTLATGTLTVSNVTMNSGASLVIDASSSSSNSDLVYVKGTLTLATNTPLVMNFLGGTPYTGNPYTVVSNLLPVAGSGSLALAPSALTRYAGTVTANANNIQVSFSGTNANLVWRGTVSGDWDVNADANWFNTGLGAADKYYQSDAVSFDDTGIGGTNVNLAAVMTPASVSVDSALNYTLLGSPIAGVAALTKSGTGTLTLLNNNTYTGVTTVSGGTLQVGNGGTLGQLPAGGTVADYGAVVFDHADTLNYNGVLNGPGQLVQAGTGTLLITATENHYGGTTVKPGGTVQLGNGSLADSGALGNGTVTNYGTINFFRASSISVAAPYTGPGALNFLGTGNSGQSAYSLNATNTFTGPVTLNLARIQSGAGAASFGSPSGIMVSPGSSVYAVATPISSVYNIPLTLGGSGWQDGLGALRMEGNGTWAGNVTLAANSRVATTSASTNTITGTITGNYELETYGNNAGGAVVLAPSAPNTYSALRVSIGTAGTKTIAGNNNAIPNNIPLTMNGGTLWLNGYSRTFSSFLNLSSSSSIQNGSTGSTVSLTLTPVLGGSSYSGTFADGATLPLNVTFTQTPGEWSLNLPTASPNWTGNLTNNGGMIYSGTQNTPFGSQGVVGRNIVGNNGAVFLTTINNALNGYQGNVILNNSKWLCNRYISMAGNAGYLYLSGSTITGTNSTDGGYENWQLPSTVIIRGTTPSYLLGGGSSSAFDLQSAGTTFDVADVTGNSASDLIAGSATSTTFLHSPDNTSSGGSLIKIGAGTLELDGANTYTGPTTISQGTLALGPSASLKSAVINLASGATLDVSQIPGGYTMAANGAVSGSGTVNGGLTDSTGTTIQAGTAGTAGTLTVTTNLTLTGSGSIAMALGNVTTVGGGVNGLIQVNGTLDLSGGTPTPVNFSFPNGTPATGTPYTIIQCTGGITGTAASAFTNYSRYHAAFSQTASAIQVTFSGSVSNLIWTGTDPVTPATWDVATSTNWTDGSGGLDIYYQLDNVRFDNTSSANTVTLGTTVTPGAITVDSTNNYTISGSGAIAGSTGITKNNTNTLTLGTVNTFTGPININAGKLTLGVNDSLPPGTTVIVSNNAVFDFTDNNGNTTTRGYTFIIGGAGPDGNGSMVDSVNGGGIQNYACVSNLILTSDSVISGIERWDIGSDPNSRFNGQGHNLLITGSGAGVIDIRSQIITNVASITISNPLTFYESYNQTNAATLGTTNHVMAGSRLGVYGGFQFNMPIELDGGVMTNQGNGTPAWLSPINVASNSILADGGAQNFLGVIGGTGSLGVGGATTVAGSIPGALTFSNVNTFTGGLIISNAPVTRPGVSAVSGVAAIVATTSNALGIGPITFDLSLMTTNSATNTARVLECNIQNGGVLPNAIVLPAATTLATNVGIQGHDSSSVFTLSGPISGGFAGLTNWMDFGDASSFGVMRLANNANSFLATLYCDRGVLAVTGDGCLGNSANTLFLNQASANGGLRFDAPNINIAHKVIWNAASTISVYGDNNGTGVPQTANTATISGNISGIATGQALLVGGGTNIGGTCYGSLTLSGSNTFNSQLTVNANTKLIAASTNGLGGTGYYLIVNPGATLSLQNVGAFLSNRQVELAGNGVLVNGSGVGAFENLAGNNSYPAALTLTAAATIGLTSGNLTLNGGISGAYPLIITAASPADTLTLAATETYSAGTVINGGTVLVNGSLPAGNVVGVGAGAVLGGSGVINGPVVVQPGAVFQPGAGGAAGKLAVNSTLNLGGNTVMYLNTTTNSLVTGMTTVDYGGALSVTNLGTLAAGSTFKLFNAQNYVGAFSSVSLPPLGANLVWSNSLAVNGTIQVVNALPSVNTNPTNITFSVSGNTLTLSWPQDHTGWRLLEQTNNLQYGVSANTNDWTTYPGSTATNQVGITINATQPAGFYQLVYP